MHTPPSLSKGSWHASRPGAQRESCPCSHRGCALRDVASKTPGFQSRSKRARRCSRRTKARERSIYPIWMRRRGVDIFKGWRALRLVLMEVDSLQQSMSIFDSLVRKVGVSITGCCKQLQHYARKLRRERRSTGVCGMPLTLIRTTSQRRQVDSGAALL